MIRAIGRVAEYVQGTVSVDLHTELTGPLCVPGVTEGWSRSVYTKKFLVGPLPGMHGDLNSCVQRKRAGLGMASPALFLCRHRKIGFLQLCDADI